MPVSIISQDADDFKLGAPPFFGVGLASRGVARRGRDGQPAPLSLNPCEDVRPTCPPLRCSGLVNGCISGRVVGGVAVFSSGGVQCKRWTVGPESLKRVVGGIRGTIKGFSRASRRRMMGRLMCLDWRGVAAADKHAHQGRAMFITLTYPADWSPDWRSWKAHLQAFRKRLERRFALQGAVWKLELQKRGAPHFHVLVVFAGVESVHVVRRWCSRAWFEVVGGADPAHFRAGTNVQVVYGKSGRLMRYLAKYLGKAWAAEGLELGRVWGVWGKLPTGGHVGVAFRTRGAWVEFCRRLRRWGKKSRYVSALTVNWSGFHVYGDGADLLCLVRGLDVSISSVPM